MEAVPCRVAEPWAFDVAACALSLALVESICASVADAGERAEAPVVAPYAPADAPPVSLAGVALAHAAELRTAVRLDIWTASYPADAVRLQAAHTSAYFYPPAPPAHGALPDVAASGALTDECRLGLLWVEIVYLQPEQDAQRADADVAAATEALSGVLGAATSTDLHWWGSARWRRKALWQHVELIAAARGTRDPWNRNRDLAFVIMAGPAATAIRRRSRSSSAAAATSGSTMALCTRSSTGWSRTG
jgi:hypothetical protein